MRKYKQIILLIITLIVAFVVRSASYNPNSKSDFENLVIFFIMHVPMLGIALFHIITQVYSLNYFNMIESSRRKSIYISHCLFLFSVFIQYEFIYLIGIIFNIASIIDNFILTDMHALVIVLVSAIYVTNNIFIMLNAKDEVLVEK